MIIKNNNMKNHSQKFLDLANLGNEIIEEYKNGQTEDLSIAIVVLNHIERTLDLGRIVMHHENSDELRSVHKQLDALRAGIVEIEAVLSKEDLKKVLEAESREFSYRVM